MQECAVPIADPGHLEEDIEYIVDSGADFDILNYKKGMRMVRRFVREASGDNEVQTGGGNTSITQGVRAQVAQWDLPNDLFLLKDSPSLLSQGKRVKTGRFTFIHCNRKEFACFINAETNHVVVFPLRRNVPVYSRRLERLWSLRLGTERLPGNCWD